MQCPVCDERLRTISKFGVEIDICPGCKGTWLDRGKLERLIASANLAEDAPSEEAAGRLSQGREHSSHDDERPRSREYREDEKHSGSKDTPGKGKRRSSWLGEILGNIGGDD